MNARVENQVLSQLSNRHLDALEEETIFNHSIQSG